MDPGKLTLRRYLQYAAEGPLAIETMKRTGKKPEERDKVVSFKQ